MSSFSTYKIYTRSYTNCEEQRMSPTKIATLYVYADEHKTDWKYFCRSTTENYVGTIRLSSTKGNWNEEYISRYWWWVYFFVRNDKYAAAVTEGAKCLNQVYI